MSTVQLATFRIADLLLGIDVARVQEVLATQPIVPTPLAPAGVLGLVNLRGHVVAATDARARLGLPGWEASERHVHVIIRSGPRLDSLVVDQEDVVVDVDPRERLEAPVTIGGAIREHVLGVHPVDGRMLLVLDVDRTLQVNAGEGRVGHAGAGHR